MEKIDKQKMVDETRQRGASLKTFNNVKTRAPLPIPVEVAASVTLKINGNVVDGLKMLTDSERVVRHRKVILELILTRWPWVDKDLLEKYGIKQSRFEENTNFCILCGLCVRYCTEVKKANVLGYIGRGTERQAVIYAEHALEVCPTCDGGEMGCRSVCPTGVIPNEFAYTGPRFGKKIPLAYPVRIYDADNIRDVLHMVGDWRMPWVRKGHATQH